MAEKIRPATPAGNGASSTMAEKPTGSDVPKSAPGIPAAASVPAFGGNRGGKARKDGLAPGSQAAKEADRKRDAERKRLAREEAARVAEPPPLPSAVQTENGSVPPPANSLVAGAPGPAAPEDAPVPWDPASLRPLFEELIEGAEESRVNKLRSMATKAALPDKLVAEIARDAKYSPTCKRTMILTAPNVTAKAMNRIGISGKYSDEAILLTAVIGNFIQGRRLQGKLQKLIEQVNKQKQPPKGTEVKS
jgi:hypothetical protein